jgi:hypothetical protein
MHNPPCSLSHNEPSVTQPFPPGTHFSLSIRKLVSDRIHAQKVSCRQVANCPRPHSTLFLSTSSTRKDDAIPTMSAKAESQTKKFGSGTREVPAASQKAQKWYPADDEPQAKKVSGSDTMAGRTGRRQWAPKTPSCVPKRTAMTTPVKVAGGCCMATRRSNQAGHSLYGRQRFWASGDAAVTRLSARTNWRLRSRTHGDSGACY